MVKLPKLKCSKKINALLIALLFCSYGITQEPIFHVDGSVINRSSKKGESNVKVELRQENSVVFSTTTGTDGKYNLKGAINLKKIFDVVFVKSGFVSKKMSFDYTSLNNDDLPSGELSPYTKTPIEIFTDVYGSEFSFLNIEPVAKFYWNDMNFVTDFDKKYNEKMNLKIESVFTKIQEKEKKIQGLISEADGLFNQKRYTESLQKYEDALVLKPDHEHANRRILELDALIQADKSKELENNQANSEINKEKYTALIKVADELFIAEKWLEAKSKYQEAQKMDTKNTYPLNKIKLCDAALIKEQNDVKNKTSQISKLLMEGSNLLLANKYSEAIQKFNNVLALDPKNADAQQKIKTIDTKYNQLMSNGEDYIVKQNYLAAIKEFNQALAIKPAEKLPAEKAQEAENLEKQKSDEEDKAYEKILSFSQTKIEEKDYVKARELIDRAIKIRPTDNRPKELLQQLEKQMGIDKEFQQKMQEADLAFAAKDFKKAIALYQQAKLISASETSPQLRIEEANNLIKAAADESKKEALYKDYINKGSIFFNAKNYSQSLEFYQKALTVKENDQVATAKIAELTKILNQLELQKNEQLSSQKQKDSLIQAANVNFENKQYDDAKVIYQKILNSDKTNQFVISRIDECTRKIKQRESDSLQISYGNKIKIADDLFSIKSYDEAKTAYGEALLIKSNDSYALQKIEQIKKLQSSKSLPSERQNTNQSTNDISLIDGLSALQQADIERNKLKQNAHNDRLLEVYDSETNLASQKQLQLENINHELNKIAQSELNSSQKDSSREITIDYLKTISDTLVVLEQHQMNRNDVENIQTLTFVTSVVGHLEKNQARLQNAKKTDFELIESEKENLSEMDTENAEINQSKVYINKKNIVDAQIADDESNSKLSNRPTDNQEIIHDEQDAILETEINATKNEAINAYSSIPKINGVYESILSNSQTDAYETFYTKNEVYSFEKNYSNYYADLSVREQIDATNVLDELELVNKKQVKNSEKADLTVQLNNENVTDQTVDIETAKDQLTVHDGEQNRFTSERLDIVRDDFETKSIEQKSTPTNNLNTIKSIEQITSTADQNNSDNHTTKTTQTQQELDAIHNHDSKKNDVQMNDLGLKYPEGVSQETESQKDDKGLLIAVITKRIVVINGFGNEYRRVQSLQATTYFKNGSPIAEHVWQTETQGPDLIKNY